MKKTMILLLGSTLFFGSCQKEKLTANPGAKETEEYQQKEKRNGASHDITIQNDFNSALNNSTVYNIGLNTMFFESTMNLADFSESDIGEVFGTLNGDLISVSLNNTQYWCWVISLNADENTTWLNNQVNVNGDFEHSIEWENENTLSTHKTYIVAIPDDLMIEDDIYNISISTEKNGVMLQDEKKKKRCVCPVRTFEDTGF